MSKLSPLQARLLDIYKEFSCFCKKHHLRYFAVAGTAIGAVRHKGFIPWDDDMDLGMPIEDFNKFKKLITKNPPKYLAFKESYWMGGKVHDTRTTTIDIRFLNNTHNYHGVYIDIFPLVGLPDNKEKRKSFIADIKSFQTNAELLEFYPEVSSFSVKEILKWKKHLQSAYHFDDSKQLAALCYFVCDGDGIRNPIVIPFEDTEIPISSNYDLDLRNHFGDYMTLPPKTERKTHDKYHIIDLERPFTQYIKEYSTIPHWLSTIINKNHLVEGELTQFSNSLQYILNQKESEINQLKIEISKLNTETNILQQRLDLTLNSNSYKLGNKIISPLKIMKGFFRHEK